MTWDELKNISFNLQDNEEALEQSYGKKKKVVKKKPTKKKSHC